MLRLTKIFTFDAAHKLPFYEGKCHKLHGHTWKLEVTVTGDLKEGDMIIDFNQLKKIVQENIIEELDHTFLNDIIENPTSENLIEWIANRLKPSLEENQIRLVKLKLYETENSYVEAEYN